MKARYAIAIAIAGGAIAQLLMKTGMQETSLNNLDSVIQSWSNRPLHMLIVLSGIAIYIFSMVIWVYALKDHKLSKAYPLLSLGYVVVYVLAGFWPGIQEPYNLKKTTGIALIVFGAWYSQHTPLPDDA